MNKDFKDLLRSLNAVEAEYLIIGGYALMEYAEPRFTKDLAVWILTTRDNAQKVHLALKNFGAPLQGLNVEDLATPGWVYQIGMAPIRVDLLTSADGVEFAEDGFADGRSCMGTCPLGSFPSKTSSQTSWPQVALRT